MKRDPIAEGTFYKGAEIVQRIKDFAQKQGLEIIHYDPVADTWQLTDGEVYSTALIVQESKL